jgi:hypothetical protein
LGGRYASDAILVAHPYSQARVGAQQVPEIGPGFSASVSPLFVDRLPIDNLQSQISQNITQTLSFVQESFSRFWCTPRRHQDDDSEECMEIRFNHKCRINYISFERSHFPHNIRLEFYNESTGKWEEERAIVTRLPIRFSIPASLPPDFSDVDNHPDHPEGAHWHHCTYNFPSREVTRWRVVLWRDEGDAPLNSRLGATISRLASLPAPFGWIASYSYLRGNLRYICYKQGRTLRIPYSLALRKVEVGYRCHKREDLPTIPNRPRPNLPPEITPVGVSEDIVGTRIEYFVREEKAEGVIARPTRPWRSQPQPVVDAVVNFYLDTRDELGNGQVIDRFYMDPTHPGPHMSIYWSNDHPDNTYNASDQLLPYGVVETIGTLTPSDEGLIFSPATLSAIDINNTAIQFDPSRPWWFGFEVRTGFDSTTPRKVLIDLGVLVVEFSGGALRVVDHNAISDSFTRVEALGLGKTDSGARWDLLMGDWQIASNDALLAIAGIGVAMVDSIFPNTKVQVRMRNVANAGIALRVLNETNYLYAKLVGGNVVLGMVDTGTNSTLLTIPVTFNPELVELAVVTQGSDISIMVDGIAVGSHTLTSAQQTKFGVSTHNGLYSNNDLIVRFEEVAIGEVAIFRTDFPGPAMGELHRSNVSGIVAHTANGIEVHYSYRDSTSSITVPWKSYSLPIPEKIRIGAPGAAVSDPTPTALAHDWDGESGREWSNGVWDANRKQKLDLQAGRGRIRVVEGGLPATGARTNTKLDDMEMVLFLKRSTFAHTVRIWARGRLWNAFQDNADPINGCALEVTQSTIRLISRVGGGAPTTLASSTISGTDLLVRFQMKGINLKAKVWAASATEPTVWTMEASSTTVRQRGFVALTLTAAATPNDLQIFWDNIRIYDLNVPIADRPPTNLLLRSMVIKQSHISSDDIQQYFANPQGYVVKPEVLGSSSSLSTDNAIMRYHPSFATQDAPWGLTGGPGDIFDDVEWTPVARDYTLSKGFVHLPPTRARFWKFEFTNLIAEPFEVFLPIKRKVKVFPPEVIEETKEQDKAESGDSGPIGTRPALNLWDIVDSFVRELREGIGSFREEIGLEKQSFTDSIRETVQINPLDRGGFPQFNVRSPTEALHSGIQGAAGEFREDIKDFAASIRNKSWSYRFRPRNCGKSAPRWTVKKKHKYKEVEVVHNEKVGFFVGLKEIKAYRVSYLNDDDTTRYVDHFDDAVNLVPGYSWALDPNRLYNGQDGSVEAVSQVFPSTHDVSGVQFATQQSQPIQIIYDDDFRDPALVGYDFSDIERWHKIGDTTHVYEQNRNVVNVSRRAISGSTQTISVGKIGIVQPLPHPAFSLKKEAEVSHTIGGTSSGVYPQPAKGFLHAAVRFSPLTTLTSDLHLQIVSDNSGAVLADLALLPAVGETVERHVTYEVGSLAPVTDLIRVQLVQFDAANDSWQIDTLSLFDEAVVWEFSVNGGTDWVIATPGVRNNPHGIVSFPIPGNQLTWRVSGVRTQINVTSMQIRPLYEGLLSARPAGLLRGPNISDYDHEPAVAEDPEFQMWHQPIPYWWFLASRRYAILPIEGRPIVTQFSRFYGRLAEETLALSDVTTRIHTHVRGHNETLAIVEQTSRIVNYYRVLSESLDLSDSSFAVVLPPRGELVREPVSDI